MKKGAWGLVCLLALLAALLLPVGAQAEGTDVVATLEIDGQMTDYATGGDYDTAEAALRAAWADAQGKTATLRLHQSVQLEDSQLWMSYNVSGTTRLTLEMDEGVVLSRELPSSGGCVIQIVFGSLEFSSGTIKATSPSFAYQGNCGIRVTYDQGELILSGGNVNIESKTSQYEVTGVELSAGSLQMTAGSIVIDHRGSFGGNQMDFTAGVNLENTATAVIGGSAKIEVTEADKHIDVGVFGVRMAGQSLTISGDPVISATLSLTEPPAAGETYNVYGIDVQSGSLTVEGAPQVSATNTTNYGCAVGLHVADGASAVVRGGDYTGTAQNQEGYGLQAAGTGLLENLSGGTFGGTKGSVAADAAVRELLTFGYSYFDDSDSEVGSDAISQMILTQNVQVKENPVPVPELRHVAQTYTAETATITAVTLPGATVYYGTDKDSLAGASVTAAGDGSVTISLSGLTPAQDYTYYLQASLDGKTSPVVETRFTTEPALSASYQDWDEETQTLVDATCTGCRTVNETTTAWGGGDAQVYWYLVDRDVTLSERVTVTGDVRLILADGCTLTVEEGIELNGATNSLTVYGQSGQTGCLTALGENFVLGATLDLAQTEFDDETPASTAWGNLTVNGGVVTATASGSMQDQFCYAVNVNALTMNAGSLTATGGSCSDDWSAFALGARVEKLVINGGTLTAHAADIEDGPGRSIGLSPRSLFRMNGGTLVATGGEVTIGEEYSASYGLYMSESARPYAFEMNGGELIASGSQAGFSGGVYFSAINSNLYTLHINGGTIRANGGTGNWSYGFQIFTFTGTEKPSVSGGNLVVSAGSGAKEACDFKATYVCWYGGNLYTLDATGNLSAPEYNVAEDFNWIFYNGNAKDDLYCYPVVVDLMDVYGANQPVANASIPVSGSADYSLEDVVTSPDGKICLLLPVGKATANFNGTRYEGEIFADATAGSSYLRPVSSTLEGTVTVSGTPKYGETLAANVNITSDDPGSLSYQWYRCSSSDGSGAVAIAGATGASYTITEDDIGLYLKAEVTAENDPGSLFGLSALVEKADGPSEPAGLQGVAPTDAGGSDGKITGVAVGMEVATNPDFTGAQDCTGTEITGLTSGTYYVRQKETATHKAGAYATVTVPAPLHTVLDASGVSVGQYETLAEAFAAAQTGYTVVLGYSDTLSQAIPAGVTLRVPQAGYALTVNDAGHLASGALEIEAGGVLRLGADTLVGSTADASLQLTSGRATLSGGTVALEAGSAAQIPSGKTFYLMLGSSPAPALNAVIESGATLTVADGGTLKAVSGNAGSGSHVTVRGTLDVQGTITVAQEAAVEIQSGGELRLKQLSLADVTGTSAGTGIKGDIVFHAGAKLTYNNASILGGASDPATLLNGTATLNLGSASPAQPAAELRVDGDVRVTGSVNVYMGVGSLRAPIHATLTSGHTATLAAGATLNLMNTSVGGSRLTVESGASLDVQGTLAVRSSAAFSGGATVSGKVYVFDTDAANPADGASFALEPAGQVYAQTTDITQRGTAIEPAELETGVYAYDGTNFANRWVNPNPAVEYTITFDPNGGEPLTPATATTVNGKLPALPTPVRKGYAFVGWFTEAAAGEEVTAATLFQRDETIYAHWLSANVALTSVSVDGTVGAISGTDITVELPTGSALPTDPARIVILPADAFATVSVPVTQDGGATWTFTVTAQDGTSRTYILHVSLKEPIGAPVFTAPTGPQDVTVTVGQQGVMTVVATDAESYQWYVNRGDGQGYVAISGATGETYTTSAVTLDNDGYAYYCEATNLYGTARSAVFTLRVSQPIVPPQTGDNTPVGLWMLLMLVSLGCLSLLALNRRRQSGER